MKDIDIPTPEPQPKPFPIRNIEGAALQIRLNQQDITHVKDCLLDVRKEVPVLRGDITSAIGGANDANVKVNATILKVDDLTDKVEYQSDRMVELITDVKINNESIDVLKVKADKFEEADAELNDKVNLHTDLINNHAEMVGALSLKDETHTSSIQEHGVKFETLEGQLTETTNNLGEMRQELNNHGDGLLVLKGDVLALEEEIPSINGDIVLLTTKVKVLEDEVGPLEINVAMMETEIADNKFAIDAAETRLEDLEESIANLEAAHNELKVTVDDAVLRIEEVKGLLDNLAQDLIVSITEQRIENAGIKDRLVALEAHHVPTPPAKWKVKENADKGVSL